MPRNAEVIRQWSILRDLEASRRLTIDDLAARTGVSTRTIRRDLEALQASGFPIYDDLEDGKRYWKLEHRAFRRLDDTGFTLAELSALYFSRTLMECLASTPFQGDLRSAFDKLAHALTPGMRQFLDRLPRVIQGKAEPGTLTAAPDAAARETVHAARIAKLVEASLEHRRVAMDYRSLARDAPRRYLVEPHRLVLAQGMLYVVAHVPEYGQLRTFAVDRIVTLSITEERFEPVDFPEEMFADSLGVYAGAPAQTVEIEFEGTIARYVRERVWHPSQTIRELDGGRVLLTLQVANDWALRNWVLGFGPMARVLAPPELAAQIVDDLDRARQKYADVSD
jgi:predicted DNA-binding transcriptional regulator YafY